MSKLIGRYYFDGPHKCRPLNVHLDDHFPIQTAATRFGRTIGNRMKGSHYECNWRRTSHGVEGCCEWANYEMAIIRKDAKFPERCRYPQAFRATITFRPVERKISASRPLT